MERKDKDVDISNKSILPSLILMAILIYGGINRIDEIQDKLSQ